MKQKLLLFIALVIGLAACTKEADADINNLQKDIPYAEFLTNAYGVYDGVWVVDQQETGIEGSRDRSGPGGVDNHPGDGINWEH